MSNVIYFPNLKASATQSPVATGTVVGTSKCLDVSPKNTALTPLYVSASATPAQNGSGSAAADTVGIAGKTLVAPANTQGFVLMNLDTSTANIRWAVGRTASATLGQQLQPGRDTGYIACGSSVTVCAESGTQNIDIQWVIT